MNLLAEGAFIGRIEELLTPDEYNNFIEQSKIARNFIQNHRDLLTCKYDYSNREDHEDHSISISKVQERDKYVKESNLEIHQKWYYINHGDLPNEYFRDLTIMITKKHYPEFPKDLSNQFWGNATFTLYEEGNFINDHRDGLDPDRLCVVLIYFSDPDSYSSNSGGELIIRTAHDEIKKVDPILGNYCVLDFSQNNLDHNVLRVNDDFKRYAYIHFIESEDFVEFLYPQKKKLEIIEKIKEDISELKRENRELKEELVNMNSKKKLI